MAADKGDPKEHDIQFGWREGRNPSPKFSILYYKDRYLCDTPQRPLQHYANISKMKRSNVKTISGNNFIDIQASIVLPYFGAEVYARIAVLETYENSLHHYTTIGCKKGLEPRPDFSSFAYLQLNKHVHHLGISPFIILFQIILSYTPINLPKTDLRNIRRWKGLIVIMIPYSMKYQAETSIKFLLHSER